MHYPSRDGEMEKGSGHPVRPTFSCFKQKERAPPRQTREEVDGQQWQLYGVQSNKV